eukprot:1334780-Rhodomonas_salina.1
MEYRPGWQRMHWSRWAKSGRRERTSTYPEGHDASRQDVVERFVASNVQTEPVTTDSKWLPPVQVA